MRDFENRDVVRILGVNPRTLIDWTEIGLVTPRAKGAAGAGTRRRYSEEDLLEIAIVQALLSDGIKRDIVKAIAGCFPQIPRTTESVYLAIDLQARNAIWAMGPRTAFLEVAEAKTPSRVYYLNVTALLKDVRARMES